MGGMHPPPGQVLVTYSAGARKALVERVHHSAAPYRVCKTVHGRMLPPSYHAEERDARYEAAKWVDRP